VVSAKRNNLLALRLGELDWLSFGGRGIALAFGSPSRLLFAAGKLGFACGSRVQVVEGEFVDVVLGLVAAFACTCTHFHERIQYQVVRALNAGKHHSVLGSLLTGPRKIKTEFFTAKSVQEQYE